MQSFSFNGALTDGVCFRMLTSALFLTPVMCLMLVLGQGQPVTAADDIGSTNRGT